MAIKSWKIALSFGLPWSMFMMIFGTLLLGGLSYLVVVCALLAGAFAGWVLSVLIRYVATNQYESIVVEITRDERLLRQATAHHIFHKERVGGKLVLTNKQLIFKSHLLNTQSHQYVIYLDQIANVKVTRTLGVLSNGIFVALKNGERHKFSLNDSRLWIDEINMQRGSMTMLIRKGVASKAAIRPLIN